MRAPPAGLLDRTPKARPYYSFASFSDPDGNGFLIQEVKERAPGR